MVAKVVAAKSTAVVLEAAVKNITFPVPVVTPKTLYTSICAIIRTRDEQSYSAPTRIISFVVDKLFPTWTSFTQHDPRRTSTHIMLTKWCATFTYNEPCSADDQDC